MKLKFISFAIIAAAIFISCEKEEVELNEPSKINSTKVVFRDDSSQTSPPPRILGALVIEETGAQPGICYYYSIYATSTKTVNYPRKVSLAIISTVGGQRSIIEGRVVTIPANKKVSNNLPILSSSTFNFRRNTNNNIVVTNVINGNTNKPDPNYQPILQSPVIINCGQPTTNQLLEGLRRFLPALNDTDFDNDGRDNNVDNDDDNDGIPDFLDNDDDNDGQNDTDDKDDDNDGIPDTYDS